MKNNKSHKKEEQQHYHQEYINNQKEKLGPCTWTFLHAVAATFPHRPTPKQQHDAEKLVQLVGEFYPCKECRDDFKQSIERNPPNTKSRKEFSIYLCERHNEVNEKIGKPSLDCQSIWRRWGSSHYEEPNKDSSSSLPNDEQDEQDDNDDESCEYCEKTIGMENYQKLSGLLKKFREDSLKNISKKE